MRVILIRHGDPDYEHDTLTERGIREAEALAKRVQKWDVKDFYVSPLGRAKKTCEIALDGTGRTAKELDWMAEFRGRCKHPDINKDDDYCWDWKPAYWKANKKFFDRTKWRDVAEFRRSNVESEYDYVADGLDALLAEHGYVRDGENYKVVRPNTDTIVLFCHFGVGAVMLSHLLGTSPFVMLQGFIAAPTSVTTIFTEEREEGIASFRVSSYGDVSHLYAEGIEVSEQGRFTELFSDVNGRH